jgi:hypothetical protein
VRIAIGPTRSFFKRSSFGTIPNALITRCAQCCTPFDRLPPAEAVELAAQLPMPAR